MSRGVGPGRPPRGSRFRKGESGNPNGRPKKPKQQQAPAFEILFDRTIPVMQNGQQRDLTVDEALQLKTYQDALAGKRPAIREVLKMIEKRDARLAKRTLTFRPLRRFMEYDSNNANEALLLLGIAERDPRLDYPSDQYERLLLQPWATQKALSRPGRRRLTKDEISEIKRCTRDADTLRWPESLRSEGDD